MAGPGGVEPVVASVPAQLGTGSLRPGLVFRGVIQGSAGNLSLQAGGVRIPLPPLTQLMPGQTVNAEVVESAGGLQLRIVPESHGTRPITQGKAPADSAALIRIALEALGALPAPDKAAQLLPANLPRSPQAVQSLLALFTGRGTAAEDLQLIASLVNQAAAAGVVPQALAEHIAALAGSLLASDVRELPEVLKRAATSARRTLEARLARALASGDRTAVSEILEQDLRAQLKQLEQGEGLRRFLQDQGKLRAFDRALERVLDRLSGEHLQNLRAFELPYLFMELPFHPDSQVRHAQVHIFGGGSGDKEGFDPKNATVVFDISTTNLGDLWIWLTITKGQCRCLFRAAEAGAVEAINASSGELTQSLAEVGYPGAVVEAALFNGDRFEAAADLMRRFAGLDEKA